MQTLSISILGLLIIFISAFFQRFRKVTLALLVITPIVLTPWWVNFQHNPFIWAKLYSAIAIAIVLNLFATRPANKTKNFYWIVLAFITLNILEAVLQNAYSAFTLKSWPHLVNALAGILILPALPFNNFLSIERKQNFTLIHSDLSWGIIFCYTMWNWMFVYLEWPEFIGLQTMLMIVPLIFAIVDRRLWVEARVYSLSIYLVIHFTWPSLVEQMNVTCTTSPLYAKVGAAFTLLCCLGLFVRKIYGIYDRSNLARTKRP